jgi:predicted RND superfamily exporter protein
MSNVLESRDQFHLCNDRDEIRRILSTEEALTQIMSKTLKHAASSMFVTSFTTSAAFFTNMLTNISFVQVFGVFTGTCILIYFVITVTAIAAFAVSALRSFVVHSRTNSYDSCRIDTNIITCMYCYF